MKSLGSRRHGRAVLGIGAALFVLGAASPGPIVDVQVDVAKEVVRVADDGSEAVERVPVGVVRPGDILVYTLRATNRGGGAAVRPRIEDPIPTGTVLLLDSIDSGQESIAASLDGGTTWSSFPVYTEVIDAEGGRARAPAAPEAYTHLRWVLEQDLLPGQSRDVRFKVRIQ